MDNPTISETTGTAQALPAAPGYAHDDWSVCFKCAEGRGQDNEWLRSDLGAFDSACQCCGRTDNLAVINFNSHIRR